MKDDKELDLSDIVLNVLCENQYDDSSPFDSSYSDIKNINPVIPDKRYLPAFLIRRDEENTIKRPCRLIGLSDIDCDYIMPPFKMSEKTSLENIEINFYYYIPDHESYSMGNEPTMEKLDRPMTLAEFKIEQPADFDALKQYFGGEEDQKPESTKKHRIEDMKLNKIDDSEERTLKMNEKIINECDKNCNDKPNRRVFKIKRTLLETPEQEKTRKLTEAKQYGYSR